MSMLDMGLKISLAEVGSLARFGATHVHGAHVALFHLEHAVRASIAPIGTILGAVVAKHVLARNLQW